LLFIHVPKTAGTSFRVAAEELFQRRVLRDYGRHSPETSQEILEHIYERPDRQALLRAISAGKHRMLCGHLRFLDYADITSHESTLLFLRDPVQRVISEYHHHARLYQFRGTLTEFAELPRERNKQWKMARGLDLGRAGLIGLSEYYEESLRLLSERLGLALSRLQLNRNPSKPSPGARYEVSAEQSEHLRRLNAKDLSLYRRASEVFSRASGVGVEPIC
jgi:hypothetical protein